MQTIGFEHLDLDELIDAARSASPLPAVDDTEPVDSGVTARVGYFRDAVFTFYYPENLEALESLGAELVPVSSLEDTRLPALDALYIGGGFPEVHAERLVQNRKLMESVRCASGNGLPIYAECGGLIYLARAITCHDKRYDMAGVFDIDLRLDAKPVGHGYAQVCIDRPCPFFPNGTELRGHEFHYSGPVAPPEAQQTCMAVDRGFGLGNRRDGLVKNNTMACYIHLHALGNRAWAKAVMRKAHDYRARGQAGHSTAYTSTLKTGRPGMALTATPVNG